MSEVTYSDSYLWSMVKTQYHEPGYSHRTGKETKHNWSGVYFYLSWWAAKKHLLSYFIVAVGVPFGAAFGYSLVSGRII